MPNSTPSVNLFETISGPYNQWLIQDVFPKTITIVNIMVIVIGVASNTTLVRVLLKRRLIENVSIFQWQHIVVDFIAYALILIPQIIFGLGKTGNVYAALCAANGVFSYVLFMLLYITLSFSIVENTRLILKFETVPSNSACVHGVVSVIGILACVVVAVVPAALGGMYRYRPCEYQCSLVSRDNGVLINIVFTISVYASIVVALHSITSIFMKRKVIFTGEYGFNQAQQEYPANVVCSEDGEIVGSATSTPIVESESVDDANKKKGDEEEDGVGVLKSCNVEGKSNKENQSISESQSDRMTRGHMTISEGQSPIVLLSTEVFEKHSSPEASSSPPPTCSSCRTNLSWTNSRQASRNKSRMDGRWFVTSKKQRFLFLTEMVLENEIQHKGLQIVVPYLIAWMTQLVCWLPYIVLTYLELYGDPAWPGLTTISLMFANVTYCTKPLILLATRRELRQVSTNLVPQSVRDRIRKVKAGLRRSFDTIDGMFASSPRKVRQRKQ